MAEPFRFPDPIEGCDCVICTRKGAENKYNDPLPLFEMYKLVKYDEASNTVSSLTEFDHIEFQNRYPKFADWNSGQNPRTSSWWKICSKLLKNLLREKDSKPFKGPVDIVALGIPDYHTYIKHPMDLSTIEQRLNADPCQYTNPNDFINDVRMVFRNCFVYNQANTYIWRLAESLSLKFEEQLLSYRNISQP